jgi:hypothetical protein
MNPSFNITQGFTFASGQQNITGNITQLNRTSGDNISDSNTIEILQIINKFRNIISQLPQQNQEDIIIDLEDVETEIRKPNAQRNIAKIRRRLTEIKVELSDLIDDKVAESLKNSSLPVITDSTENKGAWDDMNPFTIGQRVKPESFIGRTALIRTAFTQIANRASLAVWGGTGMGKSSFLQMLTYPEIWQKYGQDFNLAVIVLCDCQSIEPFNVSRFWRGILESIKYVSPKLTTDIDPLLQKEQNSMSDLRLILHKIGEQNQYLVLLIDNYDVTLRCHSQYDQGSLDTFLGEWRTFLLGPSSQGKSQPLSAIVTSSRPLDKIGPRLTTDKSPWYNHYLYRAIKPFSDQEADAFLAQNQSVFVWKEDIRKIADGNPALLQNACYLLYEELRFRDACHLLYGELHSRNILNHEVFIQEFQAATLPLFQAIWDLSTETEQTLLMLLALLTLEEKLGKKRYALGGIDTVLSQKEMEFNILVDRGILKRVERDEKSVYTFCSSVMEWWVVQQIQNSQEEELNKRQKSFLRLMSRQQSDRVMAAFRWIWQNKERIAATIEQVDKFI